MGLKTWQGRFAAPSNPVFEAFTSSIAVDRTLAPYDVQVSRAHARALNRAGVVSPSEADRIVMALDEIEDEIGRDQLQWRDELEDVHTHIEARLREKIGDLAGALHAGRSRNDQVAADLRLYTVDHARRAQDLILDAESALIRLAADAGGQLMPGYTHLQQAQPVLIGYPLLAYAHMLDRDGDRFRQAENRALASPLGSGALAGVSFPIDRHLLAREAGFRSPIPNSLDAVGDRDFALELVFASALCMAHLSRLAEDLIIWSTSEFGFVVLPDAFSSGSSMMPQKKNPDVLELIRGKAAIVAGDLSSLLSLVKGLPVAYSRDLQEDKAPLFHAAATVEASLTALAAMLPELRFDVHRAESTISGFTLATDLADELVRNGVPFREAHRIVAGLVSRCLEQGADLDGLTDDDFRREGVDPAWIDRLSARASVDRKSTYGSTNPAEVRRQVDELQESISSKRRELEARSTLPETVETPVTRQP